MKSFTIYKLEDEVSKRLMQLAQSEGTSLNQTVKTLLRRALGFENQPVSDYGNEYEDLFASWTDDDYQEFEKSTTEFSTIATEDWR